MLNRLKDTPLLLLILLCVFFVQACEGVKPGGSNNQTPPGWVMSPKNSNEYQLFGIGNGTTIDIARKKGLLDIAEKLLVEVSSSSTISTNSDGRSASESFKESIKTHVNETPLTQYKVDKVEKVNDGYWVQVSVERQTLIQETQKQLLNKDRDLSDFNERFIAMSSVERFINANNFDELLNKSTALMAVLNSLGVTVKSTQYIAYKKTIESAKNTITVVVSGRGDAASLVRGLQGLLLENKVNSPDRMPTKTKLAVLQMSGEYQYFNHFGQYQVQQDLLITLKDENGGVVFKEKYSVAGSSVLSHQSAKRSAVNQFLGELSNEGFLTKVGLKSNY
ncbi:MAG: hypothetical protein COA42_18435 [Alteromonadaceae bacterium]|nr:MAG: hypothetical protein COA42_18435 [Alteromonadaceae bacterium]